MEVTIISSLVSALVQNPAILVPMLVLLGFLYVLYQSFRQNKATIEKNERMTQAVIDDANARESDYKTLVTDVMIQGKQREDKLMNTIDTTIASQTNAIKELTHSIVQLNTNVITIESRVEKLEEVQK